MQSSGVFALNEKTFQKVLNESIVRITEVVDRCHCIDSSTQFCPSGRDNLNEFVIVRIPKSHRSGKQWILIESRTEKFFSVTHMRELIRLQIDDEVHDLVKQKTAHLDDISLFVGFWPHPTEQNPKGDFICIWRLSNQVGSLGWKEARLHLYLGAERREQKWELPNSEQMREDSIVQDEWVLLKNLQNHKGSILCYSHVYSIWSGIKTQYIILC